MSEEDKRTEVERIYDQCTSLINLIVSLTSSHEQAHAVILNLAAIYCRVTGSSMAEYADLVRRQADVSDVLDNVEFEKEPSSTAN